MSESRVTFPGPHDGMLPEDINLESPPRNSMAPVEVDRCIGSIVGLATGDALGASVEFRPHHFFDVHPVKDMQGGGTWGLRAGQWTDDTSMALCLASSLITKRDYDPYDQMVRYNWWYRYGYLSSTGKCFDIGKATRESLETFSQRQNTLQRFCPRYAKHVDDLPWKVVESEGKFNINCSFSGVAGNGALMRLAPLPLFFYQTPEHAVEYAGRSARLTHGDDKAVDACRYYAALIVAAVRGEPKDDLLSKKFYKHHQSWFGSKKLHHDIVCIAEGSFKRKKGYKDGIRGTGYVVNALEAALWAFWDDDNSFEKGALAAVNLGDDTDTTAAIYGQLAGAYYGYRKIPQHWCSQLHAHHLLIRVGEWLHYYGNEYNSEENNERKNSSAKTILTPNSTIPNTGNVTSTVDSSKFNWSSAYDTQEPSLPENRPTTGQSKVDHRYTSRTSRHTSILATASSHQPADLPSSSAPYRAEQTPVNAWNNTHQPTYGRVSDPSKLHTTAHEPLRGTKSCAVPVSKYEARGNPITTSQHFHASPNIHQVNPNEHYGYDSPSHRSSQDRSGTSQPTRYLSHERPPSAGQTKVYQHAGYKPSIPIRPEPSTSISHASPQTATRSSRSNYNFTDSDYRMSGSGKKPLSTLGANVPYSYLNPSGSLYRADGLYPPTSTTIDSRNTNVSTRRRYNQ